MCGIIIENGVEGEILSKLIYTGNELSVHNPELLDEWDYEKNAPLTPDDVTFGSDSKVWWKCKNCGHRWKASISHRVHGRSCPLCSRKIVVAGVNDLATTNPEILDEWNYEKNSSISPKQVSAGSSKKVWWKCRQYGHEWQATPCTRLKGIGCPVCANKKVLKGFNDLLSQRPDIAKDWDYDKNDFGPDEVVCGSEKRANWKCHRCGHEWNAIISSRYYGRGCPKCNNTGSSFPEQAVYYYVSKTFKEVKSRWTINQFEFDVYVPSINTAIEYDGVYYHNNKKALEKDNKKDKYCKENGLSLIRIRDNRLAKTDYATTIICKDGNYDELEDAIKRILSLLNAKNVSVNLKTDKKRILSLYNKTLYKNSIAVLYPDIAGEWSYEKNYPLTPDKISYGSQHAFWWTCSTCGYDWQAAPATRVSGCGCPVCAGKKVMKGFNDLVTTNPEIAKQWHPTKNGDLTPYDVTKGSHKVIWWLCDECGHEWKTSVHSRHNNCPICGAKQARNTQRINAAKRNSLAANYPNIASEWNYDKNEESPENYASSSNKKVWWICHYCGKEWESSICTRTRYGDNYGCADCKRKHRNKR